MKIQVTTEVVVCDICQDRTRPTKPYGVTESGRTGEVELCEEDAIPFERVLDETTVTRAPEKKVPARRPRRGGIEVTPIDQIH